MLEGGGVQHIGSHQFQGVLEAVTVQPDVGPRQQQQHEWAEVVAGVVPREQKTGV